jgi:Fe-S cluster biosynthesis and repair protein YggX
MSKLPVSGQFSMEDFLSNSVEASEIKTVQSQIQFIDAHDFKSPVIREVEFRMRATHIDEGLDTYKLRFSPINPQERNANKDYLTVLENQMNVELKWQLNEILHNRYQLMIELYMLYAQQLLVQDKMNFYDDILTLAREFPESIPIKDVIVTDKALIKAHIKSEELNSKTAQLKYLVNQTYTYSNALSWEDYQLVSTEQIKEWITTQDELVTSNNLFLQNQLQKQYLDESMLAIKQKKSFSNIGYLQAEYRKDTDNGFGKNFGLQLGFSLPFSNPDKPDLQRRELDILQNSLEIEEKRQAIHATVNFHRIELTGLIKQYDAVIEKKNDYLKIQANQTFHSQDVLFELQEFQFELLAMELTIYGEILEKYIALLSNDGKLAEAPYLNYLSATQNNFNINY